MLVWPLGSVQMVNRGFTKGTATDYMHGVTDKKPCRPAKVSAGGPSAWPGRGKRRFKMPLLVKSFITPVTDKGNAAFHALRDPGLTF